MNKSVLRLKKAVHAFFREINSDPEVYAYVGDEHYCPVCKTGLKYFMPASQEYLDKLDEHQLAYPLFSFETMNIFRYSCPKCYSSDRDRLYTLYIEKRLGVQQVNKRLNLLDIAPTPALEAYLRPSPYFNYRSADLYIANVDDKVDITDMNIYEDGKFDVFICSHVLEHVPNDKKALSELYRVLKPGGWGIAMVPICMTIEDTLEDPAIQSEADRWKYYAQDDHVRMYSKQGFVNNLKSAGFKVNEITVADFSTDIFDKHGIHRRSVLYIVEK